MARKSSKKTRKASRNVKKHKVRKVKASRKRGVFRSRVVGGGVSTDPIVLVGRNGRKLKFRALKAPHCKHPPDAKRVSEAKKLSHHLNKTLHDYNKDIVAIGKKQKNALSHVHKVHQNLDKKAAKKYKKSLMSLSETMVRSIMQEKGADLANIEREVKKQLAVIKRFNSRR